MISSVTRISFGVSALLMVCLLVGYMIKRHKLHWFPESTASVLIGFICGGLVLMFSKEDRMAIDFNPAFFFYALLPPIVLEAGYTMHRQLFFKNMSTILVFAVLGTVVATFVTGLLLFWVEDLGWLPGIQHHFSLLHALIFGALISAVDPVATLAILGSKDVNADKVLYSLVFGESVLNDAVCIALFDSMKEFDHMSFGVVDIFEAIGIFIGLAIGSVILGVAIGLGVCLTFRKLELDRSPAIEFLLVFLSAYASYALAELVHLSGIIAIFFSGVTLAHYNWYNISTVSRHSTHYGFKALAVAAETFVFIYIGVTFALSLETNSDYEWSFPLVVFAILACFIARAAHIFTLSNLANLTRKHRITWRMQVVMWFAGLRGAIAFALALNMPGEDRSIWLTTTLAVVIFTTFFCGGLTSKLVSGLGLKGKPVADAVILVPETERKLEEQDHDLHSDKPGFYLKFKRFDHRVMKPVFGGDIHDRVEERRKQREAVLRRRQRARTMAGPLLPSSEGHETDSLAELDLEQPLLHQGMEDSPYGTDVGDGPAGRRNKSALGYFALAEEDEPSHISRGEHKRAARPVGTLKSTSALVDDDGDLDDPYARQADLEPDDEGAYEDHIDDPDYDENPWSPPVPMFERLHLQQHPSRP